MGEGPLPRPRDDVQHPARGCADAADHPRRPPQYLLPAKADLTDSCLSAMLPQILSPYGVYLARVYAAAAVPGDVVEAGRMDGASEWRIFTRVALPMTVPGLVTVFLFQFVAIWNNFLLPYIMLSDDESSRSRSACTRFWSRVPTSPRCTPW